MINLKRLARPMKKSGYALPPGETTEVRNLVITNNNKFTVYVDKWSRKVSKKK